jgi:Na+/phosphate symporter
MGSSSLERQYPGVLDLPRAEPGWSQWLDKARRLWERIHLGKIALLGISLFLFVLAIVLMKEGARGLTPLVRNHLSVNSTTNCLGFGWLFAYLIMSGSPVAAAALTFFDAGVVDQMGAFVMITGSRLGASFIVLLLGFLYVLRGRDKSTSLSMGLLSLAITGTTHLLGLVLGTVLLQTGVLNGIQLRSGALLTSAINLAVQPIADFAVGLLPGWGVFLAGLGIILLSFNLFDRCLPDMSPKEGQVGLLASLVYRPGIMFALGALVTMVSMSVSLSLSILVPLSNRGLVRRENVIPYIMGANITTFVDTLLAAVLLNNPPAFTIVFVEMASIALVSVVILLLAYRRYERMMSNFVSWVVASNRNLAAFMAIIFAVPILLMLL